MDTRPDTNIWPLLTSTDALALRGALTSLGFTEGICVPGETDRSVQHSEMLWPEGGRVMVCSAAPDDEHLVAPGSAGLYVVTQQPDDVLRRAEHAGLTITRPIEDTDYGSRGFSCCTEEGHAISFGTYAG